MRIFLSATQPAYPDASLSELQQWVLRHDRPDTANTVSVPGQMARAAIRTAIAPDRRTQNPRFCPLRARPLFGAPTLAKSHAQLLFGFMPILRLRAYYQGHLTFETASPGLREEQIIEVRVCFPST
jgi:hypothetical protein